MKLFSPIGVIVLLALSLQISGCATVVNGKTQEVTFSSDPLGATVFVDGLNVGTTPTAANLTRTESHAVRIEKPGFVPYEMTTVTIENGWTVANAVPAAVFPPLFLLILPADAYLGGGNAIRPTDVSAQLIPGVSNPKASNGPVSEAPHTTPSDANQPVAAKNESQAATSSKADP
jgi:hypothetical protein